MGRAISSNVAPGLKDSRDNFHAIRKDTAVHSNRHYARKAICLGEACQATSQAYVKGCDCMALVSDESAGRLHLRAKVVQDTLEAQ